MKNFSVIIFVLLVFPLSALAQEKCQGNPVNDDEKPTCSFETVELFRMKTSEINGIVVEPNEAPLSDAIIELYEAKEDGRLLQKIKTGKDGTFCFKNLPKGKYYLKVGWSKFGFDCSTINIEIIGKTKRLVTIPLEVGN